MTDGSPVDDGSPATTTAGAAAVTLDRIAVYPVKSLDAEFVDAADIVENGGLRGDREYAMFDEDGEYVNGKRERAVHRIRSAVSLADGTVELSAPEMDDYDGPIDEADGWLSEYFGYPVELRRDPAGGFPDDTEASGPTVISTGTLDAVASWFDGVDGGEMRRRLRPNLVLDATEPFWEDHLFDRRGRVVEFSVGRVAFEGVNPCQRCVVPSRDPDTGEETPDFRTTFMTKRREALPEWSGGDWFDHDFRLMVNTAVPESSWGETLSVGDVVTVGDVVPE
ncbi:MULTISPECIES: MOSC domain-containing protein [Haloferax]|uniref:MOSC domain protein n=1 Tax=Haloferax massiliensis TaxID=1476858 RepID=A0A0D6JP84_9EURY|nr:MULTISPECIES: MOSC N-terminal beta barrel domain-containing protein [Haloferax]MDS0241321.1 MOSC N-terminal beta barrel domain-containing protein [Haloferax sp. S2CR25]MDS0444442.1 MOSC N-terminal beta barrel domain-containing protein [Haloferax sp. S2CR25-2]CQR49747.1 MOSC domain protein [Haloferax massiliensis]